MECQFILLFINALGSLLRSTITSSRFLSLYVYAFVLMCVCVCICCVDVCVLMYVCEWVHTCTYRCIELAGIDFNVTTHVSFPTFSFFPLSQLDGIPLLYSATLLFQFLCKRNNKSIQTNSQSRHTLHY